ncbi:MAG: pyruvate dehydrogenase (acetyl-transferring) E1 component subunit alpha [Haloarculaceae archaeon]
MDEPLSLFDRDPGDTVRVLDSDGRVVAPDLEPELSDETLLGIYRDMRTTRHFDERMVSLQRQGRLGTYSPSAGQEGSQIGTTYALAPEDWISYQYREHGAVIARGFPHEYVRYWAGHESGNAALADANVFPLNISIGGHIPHATGFAWAQKLKGDGAISVCHFGDGATSEGDFHEALNFAGVFDVPAVFVCHNNGWAISIPRERQTASETLAVKAHAYGFDGIQVDGMDPLASYVAMSAAAEKARSEGERPRPTLLETIEYRFGAHTTADDPDAYRDEAEVERWRERDPIDRFETYLRDRGVLDDEGVEAAGELARERVAEAVDAAEAGPDADPEDLFTDAYAEPTPRVREAREELRRLRERHGDDALVEED